MFKLVWPVFGFTYILLIVKPIERLIKMLIYIGLTRGKEEDSFYKGIFKTDGLMPYNAE